MTNRMRIAIPILLAASLALAGCESSEERAERHYQSGIALLEAGDKDRALVELRNVFKYDGQHKDARKTYADILLEQGRTTEAYSQYLRLIEQYPDTPEVRLTLAELAVERLDWEEAERHGRAAIALSPDVPGVQIISAALDYRDAAINRDADARGEAAARARGLLADMPQSRIARSMVIDDLVQRDETDMALAELDRALEIEPGSLDFQGMKFRLLALSGDMEATGEQLRTMFRLFPDNEQIRTALTAWYFSSGDLEGAEAFLREIAGAPTDEPGGHVAVVQLVQRLRGPDAARAELKALTAAAAGHPNADLFRALHATIDFERGLQAEAIAAFEEIVRDAAPSDQTRRIKVMLARLLTATGNNVGARSRIEEVLAEDGTNVDALKMRAAWAIEEDRPAAAISDLRTALNQAPRDAEVLTLMAQAHERDGSRELAGERLALAVEVSGNAPAESLRYVRYLLREGRRASAEAVLTDARRTSPGNVDILTAIADFYMADRDWARAREAADALGAIESEAAQEAARRVQAALLLGQEQTDDGIAFLQQMVDEGAASGQSGAGAVALILQTQLRAGRPEEARAYIDGVLAEKPDDPALQMLSGSLHAVAGEAAQAEAQFRATIASSPGLEAPVRLLFGLLAAQGRHDEASAVLDAGIERNPESTVLNWIKAGEMERRGDRDGAIAVYERLYALDSNNPVIANNLASMITTHRSDPESLERAFSIARRLRGVPVPAFQDTYGWIEYRRGNLSEALSHLEPAAAGLPNDPLVQFHLGMTYAALERAPDAITQLEKALQIAGDSPLPQFQTARETLETLRQGTGGAEN